MASLLPNPPSVVSYQGKKYVIFDAPNDENLPLYVKEFKKEGVVCIARACEPTYSIEPLTQEGIEVEEFAFPDGSHPSKDVVNRWVRLVRNTYKRKEAKDIAVGVHCVAGLGRAPVLVAIALIEDGMDPIQAVEVIRNARRGSINTTQLNWLKDYRPKAGGCIAM